MEFINKIELQGIVGCLKQTEINGEKISLFTLLTNREYKVDGTAVKESTWHNIVAYMDISAKKGDKMHIIGRLRQHRYERSDGTACHSNEVIVEKAEVLYE